MQARQIPVLIGLLLAAAVSGWLVWLLREPAPAPVLVGPPRSDYFLTDFSMVALDADGREAFAARGPRLARHPQAGTLEVSEPEFTLPDAEGGRWLARSEAAWVSADASELRLLRAVQVTAPAAAEAPSTLQTERLDLFPRARQMRSAEPVTASGPGFILRGVGLEAELDTRRFRLLDQVSARYEPLRADGRLLAAVLSLIIGAQALAASADRLQEITVVSQDGDVTLADGDSILSGEVIITQGSLDIRADKATLTRSAGELSQVVFEGQPASLKQIDDQGQPVSVRARKITYRPTSNEVLLEGAVEVDRPEGNLQGEVITYDMANGRLNARGAGSEDRIRMRFQPRQGNPASAPAPAPASATDGG